MKQKVLCSIVALALFLAVPPGEAANHFQAIPGKRGDSTASGDPQAVPGSSRGAQKPSEQQNAEAMAPSSGRRLESVAKITRQTKKLLSEANKLYWEGKLDNAEDKVEQVLLLDPQHDEAAALRTKIGTVKEKISIIKKEMAREHNYNAKRLYKEGNILDAVLEVRKSLELNPDSQETEALYLRIAEESQKAVYLISEKDRKKFIQAMQYFLAEDFAGAARVFQELEFDGAVKIFRELQKDTPEMVDFLNAAVAHLTDQKNKMRSHEYFAVARKYIKEGKFKKAQEHLYLSLAMDRENQGARFMLIQVNEELGDTRASSLGGTYFGNR